MCFRSESKWTDKTCSRHKHSFTQPCYVIIRGDLVKHMRTKNYRATKCEFCNSFIEAKFVDIIDLDCPVLEFEKTKFSFGFKDIMHIQTW
jgi:hypothetical protein